MSFPSVSIVDFEQVNVSWVNYLRNNPSILRKIYAPDLEKYADIILKMQQN